MKEHYPELIKAFLYGFIMALPVVLSPPAIATETRLQGWEVDQGTIINLFNIQSQLEAYDDEVAELLANKNLIPVFQSMKVTSPDLSGFRGMASITQLPPENGSMLSDHKTAKQLQAQASYSSAFENGSVNFWLGALWQEHEIKSITTGFQAGDEKFGYNIGVDLNYAGFSITGSYYSGQALDTLYFNPYYALDSPNCLLGSCVEFDNEGYILKGAYALTQTTKLGISYGESSHYSGMNVAAGTDSELWTVGLYHDVNSWLKITAEYSSLKSSNYGLEEDTGMISVGGFIRW